MGHASAGAYSQFRRIAVIRALQLGDLLCLTPALRALRCAFPRAEVTLIGLPWSRELRRRFPTYIDNVLEFPGWPGIPERDCDPVAIECFLREARLRYFDVVLQAHGDGSVINEFAWSIPARLHAGFVPADTPPARRPETACLLPYPEQLPEPLRLLRLTEHLGIPSCGTELEFPLTEDDRDEAERLFETTGIVPGSYVCLHPGARADGRRWPAEHFAAIANAVASRGMPVLVTGTADEQDVTAAVIAGAGAGEGIVNLTGRTSLGGLGAVLEGARLLVANDTGISHLAAAIGTPSVIVFTGSERGRWAPLDRERHIAVGSGSCAESGQPRAAACCPDAGAGPSVEAVLEAVTHQLRAAG